jgi:hypothetical protein
MADYELGGTARRQALYGPTPTPETVVQGSLPEEGLTRNISPHPHKRKASRAPSTGKAPVSRVKRRKHIAPVHVEPTEVFRPEDDGPEVRDQVKQLKQYSLGRAALDEALQGVLLADETRRSMLIQRTGEALRASGISEDLLIRSAERLADLTLPLRENG